MLCPGKLRSGRRRSAQLLLLVRRLLLWSALSYASSFLVSSAIEFAANEAKFRGEEVADYPLPAFAAALALCCCSGCAVVGAALLVGLQHCHLTERRWRRIASNLDSSPLGVHGERCGGSRCDGSASGCSALRLPLLLPLAFCHAATTLCDLAVMATSRSCGGCSAILSVEPLAAATLAAAIADVVGADALQAGVVLEPLASAAILGLPLASYGATALLEYDEWWSSKQLDSKNASVGLAVVGIATVTRLCRNLGLKAAYGRLDAAAAAAAGGDDNAAAPLQGARLSLFATMNTAACLWLLPAAAALGVADGEQQRLSGFAPRSLAAGTFLHGVGSMLSLLAILPAVTLVEHATASLAKNVVVATALAVATGGKTMGSRHAAACTVIIIGVIFIQCENVCKVDSAVTTTSKRHLGTLRCAMAVVCYIALLWSRSGSVDGVVALSAPSSARSGGCYSDELLREGEAVASTTSQPLRPISTPWPVADFRGPPSHQPPPLSPPPPPSPPPPDILADEPLAVGRLSNELQKVDALVSEARRLLDALLGRLLAGHQRAVLVNLFWWPNKGDHLITVAELRLLERHNVSVVHACMFPAKNCSFERVPRGPDLVVLLQGGGYAGHPSHQGAFDSVVRSFPDQRVVLLPNSLCYPVAPCSAAALATFACSLLNHSDFHVVLRDAYSYKAARRAADELVNGNCRVGGGSLRFYLAPDVAWAVESLVVNVAPVYDIVWLKRTDWESMDSDPMPPLPAGLRVQVLDWVDSWMGQKEQNYWEHLQLRALSGVAFLSRGRVVISDRLHAHIMSQLMRKPNVLINSKTQKQGHYYTTWERNVETSRLASNNSEALTLALDLLRRHGGAVSVPWVNPVGKL